MKTSSNPNEFNFTCYTCGAKMMNMGESANPRYLVIECPECGEAFLFPKSLLKSKLDWERIFSFAQ
jgi:DNA-directed RNA polymerase subunit RPC12/RpoP